MSLHTWRHQGPCKPSSCTTCTLNSHWGRAATGKKKSPASMHAAVVSNSSQPRRLWPARFLCQRGGSPGKSTERVLANTGCHTLLEHSISCCLSCQTPGRPGAARTSATQAAAPPPHLDLTGANPSPPGQPQELDPSGRAICRSGNKTRVETQGQCG